MIARDRPDACDMTNIAVLDECFKAIKPENFVVIFNKANKRYNKKKAIAFFKKSSDDAGVKLPILTEDQVCIVKDKVEAMSSDNELEGEDFEDEIADACGNEVKPFIKGRLLQIQQNIEAQKKVSAVAILTKVVDKETKAVLEEQQKQFEENKKRFDNEFK